MATAAWAGRQLMAVAQHVLVPVSRDADDVLRELVTARVRLRETIAALRALTAPVPPVTAPSAPVPGTVPVSTDTLPDTVGVVLEEALRAVSRVDEATVRVMRERRPRS
ncbi:hypothetical protein OG333_38410 (plasmid) [Streptomyces anulatus]|uniref:hypothetical protein n=1 Tax=Streptomyces anulatus TaxID=1892 RepID=UPI002F914AFD|nr:hypothetical protein OG333_38410 [Streptomyces anulatus]